MIFMVVVNFILIFHLKNCITSQVCPLKLALWYNNMQSPDTEDVESLREDLEVIKVIGRGSGGTVQLVRHKGQGTFYALKVLFYHYL